MNALELQPQPLDQISEWIRQNLGIVHTDRNREVLETRLNYLCVELGIESLEVLKKRLLRGSDHDLQVKIAQVVSTNFTSFFREPETLEHFATEALGACSGHEIRIWSAAAASGEEAHSLAMLAAQKLGPEQALIRCKILGTDISHAMVQTGEKGVYSANVLQGANPLVGVYSSPHANNMVRINDNIRKMCIFRRFNLTLRKWPFSKQFHIVFCRNVFYYFEKEQQELLVNRIYEHTAPGGWFYTSVTESMRLLKHDWQYLSPGRYRKV